MGTVCGVGVSQKGLYEVTTIKNGKKVRTGEYATWYNMIERCYSEKFKVKYPSYLNCTTSDNFKNFQYTAEWLNEQKGWGYVGYQLDKDILIKGNKLYSEQTCVIVPRQLNTLLIKCDSARGEYPVGVSYDISRNKFFAHSRDGFGKKVNLGRFDTQEQAFKTYKTYKEKLCKSLADFYRNKVDDRVIEVLLKYEVSVDD